MSTGMDLTVDCFSSLAMLGGVCVCLEGGNCFILEGDLVFSFG